MKCKHCEKCDKLILHSMLTFFISGTGVICETETRILEIELICLDNKHYSFHILAFCSGESKGHALPLGPNSFIFMQFSAQILQNNRLAPPWETLDLPLYCFSHYRMFRKFSWIFSHCQPSYLKMCGYYSHL